MDHGWASLLTAALAMLLLRAAGLALAWRLPPSHPAIAWATAVSEAALAAWVVLALVSPGSWPVLARLIGVAAGLAASLASGRLLLPGMAAGLGALWAADTILR